MTMEEINGGLPTRETNALRPETIVTRHIAKSKQKRKKECSKVDNVMRQSRLETTVSITKSHMKSGRSRNKMFIVRTNQWLKYI